MLGDGDGLATGDPDGDGEGDGVGLVTLLARALLEVVRFGVVIGEGPTLVKYSATGTMITPAMTVRTKVTAPHSLRSTPQFTSR